jgi:hypothetical protein
MRAGNHGITSFGHHQDASRRTKAITYCRGHKRSHPPGLPQHVLACLRMTIMLRMRLSAWSDYAPRALIELAAAAGRLVTAEQLSRTHAILGRSRRPS